MVYIMFLVLLYFICGLLKGIWVCMEGGKGVFVGVCFIGGIIWWMGGFCIGLMMVFVLIFLVLVVIK